MQKRFVLINVFLLVIAAAALATLGIVMLTSTGPYAVDRKNDPTWYLTHQLMWLGIGGGLCLAAAIVDYRWLEKRWWILYALAAVLLLCCFAPGIGKRINGSSRWIGVAGQTFQPSEIAKLAVIVALAWWFSRKETQPREFLRGFVFPLGFAGLLIALIAPEVDLGTSSLIAGSAVLMMFVAGTRIPYLGIAALAGAGALALLIRLIPERLGRLLAFLDPAAYPDEAHQQLQGLIALGNGGIFGLGLGNGRQKLNYLPFAHTDFIFPVIGEELGLICTLGVVLAFVVIAVSGTVIATRARDRFGKLLGFGIVAVIALQAAMNIGVTTMVLPNKGIPLPFISYGGSNLVFCLLGVGILVSIYRRGFGERPDPEGLRYQVKFKQRKTPRI